MSPGNDYCTSKDLIIYGLVMTTINTAGVFVVIMVVIVMLRRLIRQQTTLNAWIQGEDKESVNGRPHGGYRDLQRGVGDTYIPRSSRSPETVAEDNIAVSPIHLGVEAHQERHGGGQVRTKTVKSEGALCGLGHPADPAARKVRRSLSLPRFGAKSKRQATEASGPQTNLKRITYELNKTDKFKRTSDECDDPEGPDDDVALHNSGFGTLEGKRVPSKGRNEYAMTEISKLDPDGDGTLDLSAENPYYFKLNDPPSSTVEVKGGERLVPGRRSMSDASFVQSVAKRFPLKMTFMHQEKATKQQRPPKKPKPEGQPHQIEPKLDNEYEPINRESSIIQKPYSAVPAELTGDYSKLNRAGATTKDNGVVPAEGYDRILASAITTTTAENGENARAYCGLNRPPHIA